MKTEHIITLMALAWLGMVLYGLWDWRLLAAEHERRKAEVAELWADLQAARRLPFAACSDLAIASLKAQGLQDPVGDLLQDLESQTCLIPFQPIGGGHPTVGAWLIDCGRWAVASVGDGHNAIRAILDFEVENGRSRGAFGRPSRTRPWLPSSTGATEPPAAPWGAAGGWGISIASYPTTGTFSLVSSLDYYYPKECNSRHVVNKALGSSPTHRSVG